MSTFLSFTGIGPEGPAGPQGADGTNSPADTGSAYSRVFQDNLQTDATGFTNFNGGVTSYDSVNNRLEVTASGSARGTEVQYTTTDGVDYILKIDVTVGVDLIRVYSEWADIEAELTTSGTHEVKFTAPAGVGAFGDQVIITANAADTFYINSLEIFEVRTDRIGYSNSDVNTLLDQKVALADVPTVYSEIFSQSDSLDSSVFGSIGAPSISLTSGQLQVTDADTAKGLRANYGPGGLATDYDFIEIYLDIEILDNPVYVQSRWGEFTTGKTISTTGIYYFKLAITNKSTSGINALSITSSVAGPTSFNLNAISFNLCDEFYDGLKNVIIGENATSTKSQDDYKGVIIGYNAYSNQTRTTAVGYEAKSEWSGIFKSGAQGIFGCASGDETIALGELAYAGGWRTSAVGANTAALGQSSSAFGAGAVSLSSHGVAFGRGCYVPSYEMMFGNLTDVQTVIAGQEIFFENSWGHKFNTPISNLSIGDHDPENTTITLHGQDAFDARFPAWDVATTYTLNSPFLAADADVVQHNGKAYKSLQTSTGVEPGVTAGWETSWVEFQDVPTSGSGSGVPSEFDVNGGHIRVAAGRSTGSGTGGTAGFQIANGVATGQNIKQVLVDALVVDADAGGSETHVIIKDTSGNQLRVGIGAADSAGAGFRTLRVPN